MMLHSEGLIAPHDLITAWEPHPLVVLGLATSAWLYFRGVRVARARSTRARKALRIQQLVFTSGLILLAIALVSPIHAWGETLFSAHMAQHELLMVVAVPLLVLGRPGVPMMWGLHTRGREKLARALRAGLIAGIWRVLSRPLVAFALQAIAIWSWHLPRFYDASVESSIVHTIQHSTFILTALLFWWSLLRGGMRRSGYGVAVIYLFLTAVHTTVLGAFITGLEVPVYAAYTDAGAAAWGLTRLEDQQLGGLIMWVPGGIAYLVAALVMFALWLRESEIRIARTSIARAAVLIVAVALGV